MASEEHTAHIQRVAAGMAQIEANRTYTKSEVVSALAAERTQLIGIIRARAKSFDDMADNRSGDAYGMGYAVMDQYARDALTKLADELDTAAASGTGDE